MSAHAEEGRRRERWRLLSHISGQLLLAADPREYLAEAFDRLSDHLGLEVYFNFLVEGDRLRLDSYRGVDAETGAALEWLDYGQAVCGTAAATRAHRIAENVQGSGCAETELIRDLGIRAYACHVLLVRDELIGTLSFGTRHRDAFEEEELTLMETVAAQFAVAIHRARLVERLEHQTQALRAAAERKDEFLAVLSHELRNPLAPILSVAERVQRATSEESTRRRMETIERQVRHLRRLVDDLLDVSRISRSRLELRPSETDLARVAADAADGAAPVFRDRGQRLDVRLPEQPVLVDGDAERLMQVIGNLLHNASKFTPAGGWTELSLEARDGSAVLAVRDGGGGIRQQDLGRIFEPFNQLHRTRAGGSGGLGVGLALARQIVDLHGGTLEAASAGLGHGSEFRMRLPLVERPVGDGTVGDGTVVDGAVAAGLVVGGTVVDGTVVEAGAAEDTAAERSGSAAGDPALAAAEVPSPPGGLRILVVEDHPAAAEAMAELLELHGHEVRVVFEGERAEMAAMAFEPQVALLDLGLPDLDGLEVARRLRCRPQLEPLMLVAVTGYGTGADRQATASAGFDHHLVKPVTWSELVPILASVAAATTQSASAPDPAAAPPSARRGSL